MPLSKSKTNGFTLIELLVVVSIISIISSILFVNLNDAREKAKVGRARIELNQLGISLALLQDDTGLLPLAQNPSSCVGPPGGNGTINEPYIGLLATDGSFPNWKGPYYPDSPLDPWGTHYKYRKSYPCNPLRIGCTQTKTVRAIYSFGPDKSENTNNDIIQILCRD